MPTNEDVNRHATQCRQTSHQNPNPDVLVATLLYNYATVQLTKRKLASIFFFLSFGTYSLDFASSYVLLFELFFCSSGCVFRVVLLEGELLNSSLKILATFDNFPSMIDVFAASIFPFSSDQLSYPWFIHGDVQS